MKWIGYLLVVFSLIVATGCTQNISLAPDDDLSGSCAFLRSSFSGTMVYSCMYGGTCDVDVLELYDDTHLSSS